MPLPKHHETSIDSLRVLWSKGYEKLPSHAKCAEAAHVASRVLLWLDMGIEASVGDAAARLVGS